MAEITASLVKELREKTGAGMMDCKKALGESDGDIEAAVDWLRKKGLAAAAKKAGRVAAEGLVGVAVDGTAGGVVEINAETDFVARNETFQGFVRDVAGLVASAGGDVEALKGTAFADTGRNVGEQATHLVATIGENIGVRRCAKVEVGQGVVASYIHNSVADGLGKIGVIVGLETAGDADKARAFGRQVAMHIAAARPEAVDVSAVDPEAVERERTVLSDQARASGKPEAIIEKMVEGRLRKYYEEVVLLEQVFVIDGETRVKKAVENAAKDIGAPVSITGFQRFTLGEGIDKGESDFASEVAATLGG